MSSATAACANLAQTNPSGQTWTHLPQFKQLVIVPCATWSCLNTSKADEPFITGTSKLNIACPIIGPPDRIFSVFSSIPPASSTINWCIVPKGTSKLQGFLTPSPETVTILSVKGLCNLTAL